VWVDGDTHYAAAAVGSYRSGRFSVDRWQRITYGAGHYAPSTFLDETGQPCVLFWIRDVADPDVPWRGALSIPYRLFLAEDRLRFTPHPHLRAARPDPRHTVGFSWRPRPGRMDQLSLTAAGGVPVLDLLARGNTLMVDTGGATVTSPLPADDGEPLLDVLVDGCVLEVITGEAVIGLPVPIGPALAEPPGAVTSWWP
jgi:beta-fructofuranosidase